MTGTRISLFGAFALGFSACVGEGIDTSVTRSNCPWRSSGDFAGAGYRIFHQVPSYCPQDVIVRSPWQPSSAYYSATITGPLNGSTVLTTTFYNASYQQVHERVDVFQPVGGEARVNPADYYPAATISVALGQERADHAVSFPDGISGNAEVDLTYKGTAIIAVVPSSVAEGEVFTLQVYPEGNELVEPITYQWFKDEAVLGDPTTSNSITAQIFGSGITVTFRVQATDATGRVTAATKRVNVPANCQNPPCPVQ